MPSIASGMYLTKRILSNCIAMKVSSVDMKIQRPKDINSRAHSLSQRNRFAAPGRIAWLRTVRNSDCDSPPAINAQTVGDAHAQAILTASEKAADPKLSRVSF